MTKLSSTSQKGRELHAPLMTPSASVPVALPIPIAQAVALTTAHGMPVAASVATAATTNGTDLASARVAVDRWVAKANRRCRELQHTKSTDNSKRIAGSAINAFRGNISGRDGQANSRAVAFAVISMLKGNRHSAPQEQAPPMASMFKKQGSCVAV